MNTRTLVQPQNATLPALTPVRGGTLQRTCACGQHTVAGGECQSCRQKREGMLQRSAVNTTPVSEVPPIVHEVLHSSGQPLDAPVRVFFEPRFGHDFSQVRVHTDAKPAESARAVNALAYTVGQDVVFGTGRYAPATLEGKRLLAHELAHVVQQRGSASLSAATSSLADAASAAEQNADALADAALAECAIGPVMAIPPGVYRRAAPYIKKITVHLRPTQSADLEWEGTPPSDAAGSDHFTVSTGKGYGDPGDPPGTCTRACCSDPMTQCAPPWNQPTRVGACCTYYGNDFWTGTPLEEHNTWKWWTPIQPYYSSRGIALHQHDEVTGEPIGHGCVRMEEPNAKRIYDYSNGRRTNVTIDGRAAPVKCDQDRRCQPASERHGEAEMEPVETRFAEATQEAVPGLEGVMT